MSVYRKFLNSHRIRYYSEVSKCLMSDVNCRCVRMAHGEATPIDVSTLKQSSRNRCESPEQILEATSPLSSLPPEQAPWLILLPPVAPLPSSPPLATVL